MADAPKKLFIVTAEVELAIYAENAREAEKVAHENLNDVDSHEYGCHAVEIQDLKWVDADLADSLPYGTKDDRTVRELFEEIRGVKP